MAAEAVAAHTYELSELLVDVLGVTDVGAYFPRTVTYHPTYHPTCHSLRLLHVGDRPTRLLRAVEGLELVDLPEAESCCGFGGTFALKNAETSSAMVADKAANIVASTAQVVTAGDWSCLMNISGALSRAGTGVRAVHLAEILASTADHPWAPDGASAGWGSRCCSSSSPPSSGGDAGAVEAEVGHPSRTSSRRHGVCPKRVHPVLVD